MSERMAADSGPTSYPGINAVARLAHAWLAKALGARLLGVYIAGSLALGDFDPITSDIDMVAITADEVDDADLARLAPLRTCLAGQGGEWGKRVEIAVIARAHLTQWRPGQRLFYFTGHSEPELANQGANWAFVRAILLTRGAIVAGPSPAELLPPVTGDELIQAARDALIHIWASFGANSLPHATTRVYIVFEIETMCRALMTIAGGGVPSKPQALTWAATYLPEEWRPLVATAQRWRAAFTNDHDLTPEPETFAETLRFIAYAVEQAQAAG